MRYLCAYCNGYVTEDADDAVRDRFGGLCHDACLERARGDTPGDLLGRARRYVDCHVSTAATLIRELLAHVDEIEGRLGAACEPCAECGHVDYRELDDILEEAQR